MNKIKRLSEKTINRIAAGEVVERPLSVVKELVENSLDANATHIEIEIERGGRNLIIIRDNGDGLTKDDLPLALERHATSKLEEDNIANIIFHGFRGEALPSIASVSEMTIASRAIGAEQAWQLEIKGGEISPLVPAKIKAGTEITVKNLFIYTPNRLRFLKSEGNEISNIIDLVERFAICHAHVTFKLTSNGKEILHYNSQVHDIFTNNIRLSEVIGKDFIDNSYIVDKARDEFIVKGWITKPTFSRKTAANNFMYVNKRIIRDKVLNSIVKVAYQGLLPHDRHPQVVLFIEVAPDMVDVNVHPAKAEVRFREEQHLRGLIISTIRGAIAVPTIAVANIAENITDERVMVANEQPVKQHISSPFTYSTAPKYPRREYQNLAEQHKFDFQAPTLTLPSKNLVETQVATNCLDLGLAKCQIDDTFIVAENAAGLVLIDQHAAHERLVLESMKQQLRKGKLQSQSLLLPEIVDLGAAATELLLTVAQSLENFGIFLERNGITQVIIHAMPSLLGKCDNKQLLQDIIDAIKVEEGVAFIAAKIEEILGNMACKNSIKAGRHLSIEEMNALLRDMENTPFSEQCNHGRPTYKVISLAELRKIFERS